MQVILYKHNYRFYRTVSRNIYTKILLFVKKLLYNYFMVMRLMQWIRSVTKRKNYSLSRDLREKHNVNITIPGIDGYDGDKAKSMRLDVLCGLRALTGLSWDEFGAKLDEEFLPK